MNYISQIIVFTLALMGVLFKSTKTDAQGKTIYTSQGLPLLTRTGKIVVTLMTISFSLSLAAAWQNSKAKDEATEAQHKLQTRLDEVTQYSKGVDDGIKKVLEANRVIGEEQKQSFDHVLGEQRQTGEDIAKQVGGSAELLRSRIEGSSNILQGMVNNSLDLLHVSTREIDRAVNPIKDVRATFWLSVPLDHPSVRDYKRRLDEGVAAYLAMSPGEREGISDIRVVAGKIGPNGIIVPMELNIMQGSSLLPNPVSEQVAFYSLNYTTIDIDMFSSPLEASLHKSYSQSDLTMPVNASIAESRGPSQVAMTYNVRTHSVGIKASRVLADPQFWMNNNGKITAITDLPRSQMVVRLLSQVFPDFADSEIDRNIREVRSHINLDTLLMNMSGGRELWFGSQCMQRDTDDRNQPFYIYNFPQTVQELYNKKPCDEPRK